MYSNSIVKIEACDGAVEDEPEVDPFMDISSLRSNVKVEVTEGFLAHSSVDLKPVLPIPPDQNDEEVHPAEFLQVKMEESGEVIKPETSESSDEDEAESSSSEEGDNVPTGKYDGVLFKDVMDEFIKKYKPIPSLLILLKSEPSLRYLPQFESVRCEPCYLGIREAHIKEYSFYQISSKKGYKFKKPLSKVVHIIKKHVSTTRHLHFTANSNNQADPKESTDFDEPGVFINDSILELIKSKFSAPPRLLRIFESDMGGNQCLVYLPKNESIRCEVCYRSNFEARSQKYDFSWRIEGKRGLTIKTNKDLAQRIVNHFITDEHSVVVKDRNYLEGRNALKKPKISSPNVVKTGNSSSTPKMPSKFPINGSNPMEINDTTLKLIKTHLDPTLLRKPAMDALIKDYNTDRCFVYLPTTKSIRCEICFRDDGIRGLSIKKRGDLVREGGMKDFNDYNKSQIINEHMKSQRHVQVLLKERRNGRDQKKSLSSESPCLINPVNVKIEPDFGTNTKNFEGGSGQLNGADSIEIPGIVIESVDIKEEKHLI